MNNFDNKLTPSETERLALLAEECGEVIQIVGKILRHGYESYHPNSPTITNRQLLEKEIGDMTYATALMVADQDIDFETVEKHSAQKRLSARPYLHHQEL